PRCAALPELDCCAAVVTGAGRGLGRGIALALAGWGARVAVLDINADDAAETARLIQRAGGIAWPARMDVTDEANVRAGLAGAAGQFGGLDLVVNSSGVLSVAHVVDLEASEWRRVL